MRKTVIFIGILSLCVLFGPEGWYRWYRLHTFENKLDSKNRQILSQNRELIQEIQDLKSPRYLQYYLHDQLGYVKEDEVIFELPAVDTNVP